MSQSPDHLKYAKSHEWLKQESDDVVVIGITDHAQEALGDLVYVELPEIDRELQAGDECAVVESVKAASDVYSPIAGKVIDVNSELGDTPELINQSPYDNGWMFKLRVTDKSGIDTLLSATDYSKTLDDE